MEPTPLEPLPEQLYDTRLWIGNLDTRLNEFQLLKILQPFGHIEKFDLLFHRSGPLEGQPRGYAFVTYKNNSEAVKAKDKLNGLKVGTKHIVVKWANTLKLEDCDKAKVMPDIPALSGAKAEPSFPQAANAIKAIEEKLKIMANSCVEPDFSERPTLSTKPPSLQLRPTSMCSNRGKPYNRKKPYEKNRRR